MSGGEHTHALWRIVRGRPDAVETAALAVVLAAALVARAAAPGRARPRSTPTRWDRTRGFPPARTWRRG
ncbi:acyl-CoA carboxylase epsilon subunit [Streptomyces bambusae]|uniref:Acyl-CoA carboxylase subunit epsilon n=1 Tax=Streptomyces bambusae TaxID=1550616 RepID=A0ABS6ZEA9_9ACTN|nr:acyl-CoA carboxylase epsilon subunit [Streptomyces bambusae]MBW5486056.1 hypothetical protein [Streptomyces bambusae]